MRAQSRFRLVLAVLPLTAFLACPDSASPTLFLDAVPGGHDALEEAGVTADPGLFDGDDATGGDAPPDVAPPPFDPARAANLQALTDEYITFSGEPGMTLTARTAEGSTWSGAAGVADLKAPAAVDPGARFRVGSTTKPVVATVVLQLVDEGTISLEDPLSRWLPEYPAWAAVTVRQLLGMRSGIPDYLWNQMLWLDALAHLGEPFTPAQLVAYAEGDILEFDPGKGCSYSNTNYVMLGMIVEKATGRRVQDEVRDRITVPLAMDRTFLDLEGGEVPGLVHGYMDLGYLGSSLGIDTSLFAVIPPEFVVNGSLVDFTYLVHPSMSWSAGALVTTTRDMTVFMDALLTGRLLKPATLEQMRDVGPCDLMGEEVQYGLGLLSYPTAGGTAWGHGGVNFGYNAGTTWVEGSGLTISHMHDVQPDQSPIMNPEWMAAASGDVATVPAACTPLDGFFDAADRPRLEVRFRGPINGDGDGPAQPGIASPRLRLDAGDVPLFGIGSAAKLKTPLGQPRRIEIASFGPSDQPGRARSVVVSIVESLLSSGGPDGRIEVPAVSTYALYATTADLTMNPSTGQANRLCVTAVPDGARPSWLAACDPPASPVATSTLLKVFGSIAMTTDPLAIDAYMKPLKTPRCICADGKGGWAKCPD